MLAAGPKAPKAPKAPKVPKVPKEPKAPKMPKAPPVPPPVQVLPPSPPDSGLPGLFEHLADALLRWDYRLLELEFRLGLRMRSFVPNVGRERFEALRAYLDDGEGRGSVRTAHAVFVAPDGGVLRRETDLDNPTGDHPDGDRWVHKLRLANFDLGPAAKSPWQVRASSSLEREEDHGAKPAAKPSYVRRRERWAFRRGPWTVDLTVAAGNSPGEIDNDEETYEVEIELADRDEFFRTPLSEIVKQGLKLTNELAARL